MAGFDKNIPVSVIHAGKFRRYNSLPMWQQIIRFRTIIFPNLVDLVLVAMGFVESFFKLIFWRPDVVFTKGGFVCLPVGLAAHFLRVPLVIHDSDAHPGLTNRILARWADSIATGAPLEYYDYPKNRSFYIGIPITDQFRPFSPLEQSEAKRELGFPESRPLIVVTGGGLGAKRLNDAIIASLDYLTSVASVLLISGQGQYDELRKIIPTDTPDLKLRAFISEGMYRVLGASDIVITRAGATTIMELAALGKPIILLPNAYLTGGHQLKNAEVYNQARAAIVLDEDTVLEDPKVLQKAVESLLSDELLRSEMVENFKSFAKPDAASDMSEIILEAGKAA